LATRVAINGFGRIGRLAFRQLLEHKDLDVVAINDLTSVATNAHLLKYDSTYGIFPGKVETEEGALIVDGHKVRVAAERDPLALPWKDLGIDIVVESTGRFTEKGKAIAHLKAGAKRVVISAPAKDEDITIVMGVNNELYDPAQHHIISNASCTTNCLVPVAKVLFDSFGIESGIMTTVHSITGDQRVQDTVHEDLRRARATGPNIIPTKTGATDAAVLVIPELKGKFKGISFRVPTQTVSVVDFVVVLKRPTTDVELNAVFKRESEGKLAGILGYNDLPLVSSDYRGDPRSSIVDGLSTKVVDGTLAQVVSWYDNEWGYACRVADLCSYMAKRGV
jgi:glyceraldehyde 3-phosphate dehydrogenase